MIGYNLNGVKFNNPFAAFLHGSIYQPHSFPTFDFYDHEFSAVDWTKEPAESFVSLCDRRAHQLRDRYDKIILAFSGGTDSTTVYNTFVRNHIHIDEIKVVYSDTDQEHWLTPAIVSWLLENHPDKTTKISAKTYTTQHDIVEYQQQIQHEDFLVSDHTGLRHQDMKFCRPVLHLDNYMQDNHCDNYCIVTGHEKPHLIKQPDGYYFVFQDHVFNQIMWRKDIEMFFVSPDLPDLHAKQCHMMLNYCVKTNTALSELEKVENYYLKCAVQGRDPEPLALQGFSRMEKYLTRQHKEIVSNIDFGQNISLSIMSQMLANPQSRPLVSAIQNNGNAIKTYMSGWHALQSDQTLVSYMKRMRLLTTEHQSVQHYHAVRSKSHKLL
jgi:hypothetical protein